MTTSLTDARFTSIHFTPGHLLSLSFDEPPESGWGVMPGFDESIPIPPHLEPPRLDADETLPTHLHPSYPFGRPVTKSKVAGGGKGVGNLLGTIGEAGGRGGPSSFGIIARGGGGGEAEGGRIGGERWVELGMGDIVEKANTKEVPPGMAGAKRPPSPPSPSLHPSSVPPPRSTHLANLYARQRKSQPATTREDPFDAPVPNETYAEEGGEGEGEAVEGEGGEGEGDEEEDVEI